MKAAIYARKSKDTQKGESTENQIKRGKDLCKFKGWEYEIYEDFDISGKNLDRPDFQRLMSDVRQGKIHTLVCYKLDRVSRSVNDFSSLIEELTDLGVDFISLKENFDTSTPMGRAMMMITSVFAQLERETIAERVRDNMVDRAKIGKWNGGVVPFGYDAVKVETASGEKIKHATRLIVNEQDAEIIKIIFDMYTQGTTILKIVEYLNRNHSKCKNNKPFVPNHIRRIVENAIYCKSDADAYNFFDKSRMRLESPEPLFNGVNGMLYYNRRKPSKKTSVVRPVEEWIVAVGEHEGIVDGKTFVAAQKRLEMEKDKPKRTGTSKRTPLSGMVRCECGSAMSVSVARKSKESEGYEYTYFECIAKRSKVNLACKIQKPRTDKLEQGVFKLITDVFNDETIIENAIKKYKNELSLDGESSEAKLKELKKKMDATNREMDNLMDAVSEGGLPMNVIKSKYDMLENKRSDIEQEYNKVLIASDTFNTHNFGIESIRSAISELNFNDITKADFDVRRLLYINAIDKIVVHSKTSATVYLSLPFCTEPMCIETKKVRKLSFPFNLNMESDYNSLPDETIAERIYKYRKMNNLTQKELGEIVGITDDTIMGIEKGRHEPSKITFEKLKLANVI